MKQIRKPIRNLTVHRRNRKNKGGDIKWSVERQKSRILQDCIYVRQDYSAKQVKKPSVEKTSVLEKLKKFKEIVAAIPKKVAEKKKERSR